MTSSWNITTCANIQTDDVMTCKRFPRIYLTLMWRHNDDYFSLFTCRKMRSFILQNACKFGLPEAVTEATRLFNNAIEQAGSGNTYVQCQWYISNIRLFFISHCYFNCHYHCLHEAKLLDIGYDLKNMLLWYNKVVWAGWVGILVSSHPSVCPSVPYAVSALWLFAYFVEYIHMWHKYNPWGDDVSCTNSRSIGQRSRSHGSFGFLQSGWGVS